MGRWSSTASLSIFLPATVAHWWDAQDVARAVSSPPWWDCTPCVVESFMFMVAWQVKRWDGCLVVLFVWSCGFRESDVGVGVKYQLILTMKNSLCFFASLDACVHVYLCRSYHTATVHWIVWHVWELYPSILHNCFPYAIFPLGIRYQSHDPGHNVEALALPKLRSMVRVLLQVGMWVPARFILEEVAWVGVFSCAENKGC